MKRKVVVTMALAFWVDDDTLNDETTCIQTNDQVVAIVEGWDEMDIIDEVDEATTIKVEITETKA